VIWYHKFDMAQVIKQTNGKVLLDRDYLETLRRKASFSEEILAFIEDRYFGYLMEKTEEEKNIPLSQAKKALK
jgi:hypothetical protein